MPLLEDLYNIQQTNGKTGSSVLLTQPTDKYFSLDINNITKEQNTNSSIFWNFGDPESTDNESVASSIVNSTVKHIFLYSGIYHIHCIVNAGGVPFHLEQDVIIDDNDLVYDLTS